MRQTTVAVVITRVNNLQDTNCAGNVCDILNTGL